MVLIAVVGAVYYYFNCQYFRLVTGAMELTNSRKWIVLTSFVVNYLFFCICSVMEFPLVLNWVLFAFLLLLETLFYNKRNAPCALFCTLIGIIYGLAVNIFCRSMISLLLNQPLSSFDNQITAVGNLKGIPVFLGFLIAGMVLQYFSTNTTLRRIRLILKYPKHQTFLLQVMTGLFIYLFLNLLLYSAPLNSILLKAWSIKSCLFCVCGFYIAFHYTRRICELEEYREKNSDMKRELQERSEEEKLLLRKASLDALTGLYNRQYAKEMIPVLLQEGQPFTLCFLDLDGLKNVNDRYGHNEGDHYIRTVAKGLRGGCRSGRDLLFRYGGDEFLVLFPDMKLEKAEERIKSVFDRLQSLSGSQSYRYPVSFSYGLVDSSLDQDWERLVEAADQKMYRQKQLKWNREKG